MNSNKTMENGKILKIIRSRENSKKISKNDEK